MSHILFYTDTPHVGGAEKQMLLLARALKRSGHKVSLAYGAYSQLRRIHQDFSVVCEKVYALKTLHKHDPRHYFALKKIVAKGNFDLIHLHLWNPGSCRYAFWASKKIPIVATEHDPFPLRGLKRQIKKRTLVKTAQIIVLSSENKTLLTEAYAVPKEKLNLIHNGIEITPFLKSEKARLPLLSPGDIVLTCIAELHERKGHRYLLEAFVKLKQSVPHLQLLLVGEGPLRASLQEKYHTKKDIHFLGWREDIPAILRASDILILPSLKEAFGLVVLEAMASGVPVIASNSGGLPDLITNGKTGILAPPGNSEKIVEAILNILHNPDQKKDITQAALENVKTHFTAQKMAEGTLQVYHKAIHHV